MKTPQQRTRNSADGGSPWLALARQDWRELVHTTPQFTSCLNIAEPVSLYVSRKISGVTCVISASDQSVFNQLQIWLGKLLGMDSEVAAVWLLAGWLLSTFAVLCALACIILAARLIRAGWKTRRW